MDFMCCINDACPIREQCRRWTLWHGDGAATSGDHPFALLSHNGDGSCAYQKPVGRAY
jgi:hypothetical protein